MQHRHAEPLFPRARLAAVTLGLALGGLALTGADAPGATYYWKDAGNASWTNVNASSVWQGDPATYPVFGDTVVMASLNNSGNPDIYADAGWGASHISFIFTNGVLRRRLMIRSAGYVDTLITSNSVAGASSMEIVDNNSTQPFLTVREFHDVGPYQLFFRANPNGTIAFTNNTAITYGVTRTNIWSSGLDFRGATSVELRKNTAATTLNEIIMNVDNGNSAVTYYLGRPDGSAQNWTVSAGSHPVLVAQEKGGMRVTGAGDVTMPDVDLEFRLNGSLALGLSSGLLGGTHWNVLQNTPLYAGTFSANSLKVDGAAATTARYFVLGGHLVLDGQGGLQAGGTGNGRAVTISAGNYDLTARLTTVDPNAGQLEITPSGGELFVTSTGTGKAGLNINVKTADATTPVIIANTLNLASPNALISDVNINSLSGTKGGTVVLRGSFLNQSTQTVSYSTATSTFRLTGRGVFEAASRDLGVGALLSGNAFQLDRLVLTNGATYSLANFADNDTGVTPEAVYVNNFEIWDNATLDLRGLNLYFQNGGGQWYSAVNYTNGNFAAFTSAFPLYGDGSGMIFNTPEPSTLLLLGVGGWLLLRVRKQS